MLQLLIDRLKVLGVDAVVINNLLFIVTKDGDLLHAQDLFNTLLVGKWNYKGNRNAK